MLKELDVKQSLLLLAEKYPEPIFGYFCTNFPLSTKIKNTLIAVHVGSNIPFVNENGCSFSRFYIEVPDEYRYMTEEEQAAWVATIGYKNRLMRWKNETKWMLPVQLDADEIEICEYCTIEIIDGKIVYSKPMEFKVKV
jgi:hypothetical protein